MQKLVLANVKCVTGIQPICLSLKHQNFSEFLNSIKCQKNFLKIQALAKDAFT